MVSATRSRTASVHDEYSVQARSYEHRWRRYLEISTAHTLAVLDPCDDETILDAGCGTGWLLRQIAGCAPRARLVGMDRTLAMLRQASTTAVCRVVGDVRNLPWADGSLDAVVMASVLQYLPKLEPVLSEVVRALRPGGRVVITSWDGGSRHVRTIGRWLRWCGQADVHLRTCGDFTAACSREGLSVCHIETYSAGWFWRLFTMVAIKHAAPD